jgi:hypothetical protein
MAALTPEQALQRLRTLYRDAYKCSPADDAAVISWARSPELWATHQVAHRGWSFQAAEAVVRQCRILVRRAARAAEGLA